MDSLFDLTPKQMTALLLFHRAWRLRDQGHAFNLPAPDNDSGYVQVIRGQIGAHAFGSATIARLKRTGLIAKEQWGYRISDRALALIPEAPAP